MIPVYDEKRSDSILKKRYEVRKNDMNILVNEHILFEYAGYFISSGEWIHPDKTEQTYEIIFVTQGTVFLCDEKQGPIEIRAGQVCLLEPGVRHYGTEISEGVRFYWVHFHLKQGCLPFEQRFFEAFEQKQLFRELLHLCNLMPQPDYAVNAVLNYILSELCRIAENEGKYAHAWFVGYSNVEDPDLVVCVLVENTGAGSKYAVPIAKKIFNSYYNNNMKEYYGEKKNTAQSDE